MKKVIGFQMWCNGREDGYGSTQRIFGKDSMTVEECQKEGEFESVSMTYVYEKESE